MNKIHMWHRMAMLGLISVKCGRMVKATQFTNEPKKVTCLACLKKMGGIP
ncbi:hypothetical protein [Pseudomonas guariconensis]|nr:hypothetical protein [Pseudomonas guariconensis]MBF8720478.1 hypothetical protein [Pseudomonas guariconensis]